MTSPDVPARSVPSSERGAGRDEAPPASVEPSSTRAVTVRVRKEGAVRRTTVYLRLENFTRLKGVCAAEDRDISSVLNEALARYLDAK